jgi:hypothetical protein
MNYETLRGRLDWSTSKTKIKSTACEFACVHAELANAHLAVAGKASYGSTASLPSTALIAWRWRNDTSFAAVSSSAFSEESAPYLRCE